MDRPALAEPRQLVVGCTSTTSALAALRDEWKALVSASPTATIFQSWDWVSAWYEIFGGRRRPLIFTARDPAGALVGAVPCFATTTRLGVRRLHLLGGGECLTEYGDLLARPGQEMSVAEAVVRHWSAGWRRWDLLSLSCLPSDGALCRAVLGMRGAGYRSGAFELGAVRRPLPDSWKAFYRSLKKSMKENANNYLNRLLREGHTVELRVTERAEELEATLDRFFELHHQRSRADLGPLHPDRFSQPEHRQFLRVVTRRLLDSGQVWPCELVVDGLVVAAQLGLLFRGRFSRYYSGFDPAWAHYGVMTVLTRRVIERAIEHGCTELDLLVGIDQEKLRWGGEVHPISDLTLAGPSPRSRASFGLWLIENRVRHRAGRARETLTRRVAPLARKVGGQPLSAGLARGVLGPGRDQKRPSNGAAKAEFDAGRRPSRRKGL